MYLSRKFVVAAVIVLGALLLLSACAGPSTPWDRRGRPTLYFTTSWGV